MPANHPQMRGPFPLLLMHTRVWRISNERTFAEGLLHTGHRPGETCNTVANCPRAYSRVGALRVLINGFDVIFQQ